MRLFTISPETIVFLKIAAPAVINDVVWSLASAAFSSILGHIGDDMVAANAVAVMVVNIDAIATYVLKLPSLAVYFIMTLDEFEKMPFVFWHYKKGNWTKNITREFD